MILHFEAFLVAITILTITPGLDTAMMVRNTLRGGKEDGLLTNFGICSGLFVHATLSAVGISLLLLHSPRLFQSIQIIGVLYLLYLGVKSIKESFQKQQLSMQYSASQLQTVSKLQSLREGFLSNVLNPKTGIFYLAFLPQFINPAYSAFIQSMLMASIHFMIALLWQGLISHMISKAQLYLESARLQLLLQRATGAVLILLALKLLLDI